MFKLHALAVVGVVCVFSGCASGPSESGSGQATAGQDAGSRSTVALTDRSPLDARVAVLTVNGLGCPLCAHNVDNKLRTVAGVEDVRVDLGTGEVTVSLAELIRPSAADFHKAVTDSGFTLRRIELR